MLLTCLFGFAAVSILVRARHLLPVSSRISRSWADGPVKIFDAVSSKSLSRMQTKRHLSTPYPAKNTFRNETSTKWSNFPSSSFSFTYSTAVSNSGSAPAPAPALNTPRDQSSETQQQSAAAEMFSNNPNPTNNITATDEVSKNKSLDDSDEVGVTCVSHKSFRNLLDATYDSHVELIRRGIPSHTVKHFFSEALRYLTRDECFCSGQRSRIASVCIEAAFYDGMDYQIASRLYFIIENDRLERIQDQKFPLYHKIASNPLPNISSKEKDAILLAKKSTVESILLFEDDPGRGGLIDPVFPRSKELLLADEGDDSKCEMFRNDSVGLPVGHYIAYTVGLATHILLSDSEDKEAEKLLREAVSIAYVRSQCERKEGKPSLIPFDLFLDLYEYTEPILKDATYSTASAFPPEGFHGVDIPSAVYFSLIIRVAYFFFEEDITFLSSIDSHGRPVVLQNVKNSVYMRRVTRRITEEISVVFLQKAYNVAKALLKREGVDKGYQGSNSINNGVRVRCPSGWQYVPRVAPVSNVMENCCSVECHVLENVIYSYIVQSEMCCKACNYLSCQGTAIAMKGKREVIPRIDVSGLRPAADNQSHGVTMVSI